MSKHGVRRQLLPARGEEQWFIQDNCGKEDRDTKQSDDDIHEDEYDYEASSTSLPSEMDKEDEEDNELREEKQIEEEARQQIEEAELIIESEGLRVSNDSSMGGLAFVAFVAFIVASIVKKMNLGGAKQLTPEQLEAYKQTWRTTND